MDKFELVSSDSVDERGLTATLFRHKATGAEVLSVDCVDDNKVFSINFRTLPKVRSKNNNSELNFWPALLLMT